MPANYRDCPGYKWYIAGADDGLRPRAMPAFNTDSQGRVLLAAGEVFCRHSDDGGATLCGFRRKFSSLGALKKHISTTHDCEAAPSHPGSLSSRDDARTMKYWNDIHRMATGTATQPDTPRKTKAILKDIDKLFPIPTKINPDETVSTDFVKMKDNVGLRANEKCVTCAS